MEIRILPPLLAFFIAGGRQSRREQFDTLLNPPQVDESGDAVGIRY